MIKTYPYSDPNPVPALTFNPKIYPYHQFTGYSHEGKEQEWKVVTMENDYIQVFVLPESGGKVWGAIEKETGEEFIYRNEVMKFRNIAMRGPWTSGGIEFNFGIIGHAPSTASPVDYIIEEKEDGSVSCTVGTIDLPSRTQWRVKITLPADKAYFETEALWYNPTPAHQAYYNWMTAAARASQDLELFYPGDAYLGHPGDVYSWPTDEEGRDLAMYKNNAFGGSKSYHVVGNYHDFFGGYWHEKDFGFGHWSLYEEMPGQKLWIWALSRSGAIWEDLLTDSDGQYIEFQAGRLLNQYSYSSQVNPVSEVGFGPYVTDQWRELWFPVKEIGGISAASPLGAVNVEETENGLAIGFNAFQQIDDVFIIKSGDDVLFREAVSLKPMEVFQQTVNTNEGVQELVVSIGDQVIFSTTQKETNDLKRPFEGDEDIQPTPAYQLFEAGKSLMKNRNYAQAEEKLKASLQEDPAHYEARVALAELHYQNAQYEDALEQANHALKADTYDFDANYVAGIIYKALEDKVNALEALGWAARSMEYRSAAYAQMAEIYMQTQSFDRAKHYAQQSLAFNSYNISGLQSLMVIHRKNENEIAARELLDRLLALDPLNHFARFEAYLLDNNSQYLEQFKSHIQNEFPAQTYLEVAMDYLKMGQQEDAQAVLQQSPENTIVTLWLAYLNQENTEEGKKYLDEAVAQSAAFVAPFRSETLKVLEWAVSQQKQWKLHYYLGLNYWAKNQMDKAVEQFKACGEQPDFPPFYLSRAELLEKTEGKDKEDDLRKALTLNEELWNSWHLLLQYLNKEEKYEEELKMAVQAYRMFPDNYVIGMDYAQALLHNDQYEQSLTLLDKIHVLPYEGASEGRAIYERAHLKAAMAQMDKNNYKKAVKILQASLEWPENLGVGKPYNPDESEQDFLLAHAYQRLGQTRKADQHLQQIVQRYENSSNGGVNSLLLLGALKKLGKTDELSKKLSELEKAESPEAKWVLATWTNDEAAKSTVQPKLRNNSYEMIDKIIQATVN
ncbi:DUF5107 domain-containing protein [Catalinimonas alkaloidigena]|uniref:DUF5107 domain-containing protein n=1 Tax=Catalinimonas alkaloidigena TaxID=1075417 RepID=UPI002405CD3E|nr:DUF5107 domain-containing protein [Catalinimonas alkaloidigena]